MGGKLRRGTIFTVYLYNKIKIVTTNFLNV